MNAKKTIGVLEMLALGGAIIGEVRNGHTMPRPATLGAIYLFYGLLGVVSEVSREAARISAAIAAVVTLSALVVGASGREILGLFDRAIQWIPGASTTGAGGTGSQPGTGGGPI
jgi:hypothetical protein